MLEKLNNFFENILVVGAEEVDQDRLAENTRFEKMEY